MATRALPSVQNSFGLVYGPLQLIYGRRAVYPREFQSERRLIELNLPPSHEYFAYSEKFLLYIARPSEPSLIQSRSIYTLPTLKTVTYPKMFSS